MRNEWPHLLADLKEKRAALDQMIASIETHFMLPDEEFAPSARNGPVGNGALRNGRTDGRSKGRASGKRGAALTPGSLPDQTDHTAQIIAAVKKAGGIVKRGELVKALDTSLYHTIAWLKVAIKAKAVVATGKKATYRISLPGKAPAKEEP